MTEANIEMPAAAQSGEAGLERYQPRDLRQLGGFANAISKSGMFLKTQANGVQVPMDGHELFFIMCQGVELGLTPLQSLDNIYLIEDRHGRKSRVVKAEVIAARIMSDPRTELWEPHPDEQPPSIRAKRYNRDAVTVSMSERDVPASVIDNWKKNPQLSVQERLFNRCIRKIARLHFKDMVLGIGLDYGGDLDETKIIDVAKIEHRLEEKSWECSRDPSCDGRMFLHSNPKGGAFLRCEKCGNLDSPPQEVRDMIRDTPEALTIAATGTPPATDPIDGESTIPEPSDLIDGDAQGPSPADVAPPPSEAPVDAAEKDGGAPTSTPREAADAPRGKPAEDGKPPLGESEVPRAAVPSDAGGDTPEEIAAFIRAHRGKDDPHRLKIRDLLLGETIAWDGSESLRSLSERLDAVQRTWLAQQFAELTAAVPA